MLASANRIKKSKDFGAVFKNSKNLKTRLFVLKTKRNNLGLNRFGFVVSQKVSKKATVRNKVKRRLAAAVKSEIERIRTGTDLVIIALPGIEGEKFSIIKEIMHKICSNL